MRSFLFVFACLLTAFFTVVFDRWGQKVFLNFALVLPLKASIGTAPVKILNSSLAFPEDFLFGVSTSAYQIEGGWNEDGKTPSTWDMLTHEHPELIEDGSNADISTNSYHFFKADINSVNFAGFQHYRFSVAWTRIMPNGSAVNLKGIEYYKKIIDACLERGIEPIVTIFHWDLPQYLHNLGGLTNPIFVDYFEAYADILFNAFGDKVKRWITVNEPYNYCVISYGYGIWAPAIKSPGVGDYLCGHHMLLAHAKAYRLYQTKYFKKFGGQIGITLESPFYFPKDSSVSSEDQQRAMTYRLGWFANPIFGSGGYPKIMVDEIAARSKIEGRAFSRLPTMSTKQNKLILGSADFFGLNYYTTSLVSINKDERNPRNEPSWSADSGVKETSDPTWSHAKTFWLYNVPDGFRGLMNWIKKEYKNPPLFITENGWSDEGETADNGRIEYFDSHLKAVAKAINEDGCNVIGFTAWSLTDSYEWNGGYSLKHGLFSVNFTSPLKERTPKKSVKFWQNVTKKRSMED